MKNNFSLLISALLILLLFSTSCSKQSASKKILAEKGTIDVSDWDFKNDGILPLNGEWEFYWKKILSPDDFLSTKPQPDGYINVPAYWNGFKINDETAGGKGFATYRLVIISNIDNETLSIDKINIMSSAKIWFNSELINETGKVTGDEKTSEPSTIYSDDEITLKKGRNELILQVDNFNHQNGGTYNSINIGKSKYILNEKIISTAYDLFLVGSLFIIALYHLGLFYLRRREMSSLYFALFAILIALRTLLTRDNFIIQIFPDISYLLKMRLEYLTFTMAPPTVVMFLHTLYPKEFKKIPVYSLFALGSLFFIYVLIAKPYNFSFIVDPYQIVLLAFILYILYGLILALIRKKEGSIAFLIGSSAVTFATVNDILNTQQIIRTIEMIPWGLLVLVFAQSYIIALRFSKAFDRNIELSETLDFQNKNLENIVDQRTTEIKQQNEEILAQKEELIAINDELQSMNEELEKLSIIARETDNAIAIMNPAGKIEWMNEGAYRLYGYSQKEYTDLFGDNLFKSSSNPKVTNLFNECIETKSSVSYESSFVAKIGKTMWMQTTLTPIVTIEGKVSKVIGIDSDITELKEYEYQILDKNDEISAQKSQLQLINDKIEAQNDHIQSSIRYANTIQQAILPGKDIFDEYFDNFILFKPKDIVSGDFYWMNYLQERRNEGLTDKKFIAVVDCTGHGVPGAFMSMISNRLLSEIVNEKHIFSPAQILEQLNKSIRKALKQDISDNKDGLDMALCLIETDFDGNKSMVFAGAKRPVFVYESAKSEFNIYKTTRKSIGGFTSKFNKSKFSDTSIKLHPGDIIYLSSDGYTDQNNEARKRFGTAHFIDVLVENIDKPMNTQKEMLEIKLEEHMKNTQQRDDITIIGIKI